MLPTMLTLLRRRHLRSRLSLLAMAALLWSQMLLALHADCPWTVMEIVETAVATDHADCEQARSGPEAVVCAAHCSQGDGSPDAPRAPLAVPALPAVHPSPAEGLLARRISDGGRALASTPAAWHRPTHHPASVLLI